VLARGWFTQRDRIVEVTEAGKDGFIEWLGKRSRVAATLTLA